MKKRVTATMLSMILLVLAVSGCGTENKETAASSAASDLPAAAASEEAAGKDAKDIKAVSYTHLDVYKRQEYVIDCNLI